jgi:hypothetical protein
MTTAAVLPPPRRLPPQGADDRGELRLGHGGLEDAAGFGEGERHILHDIMVPPRVPTG